jgi:hypothetical protein
MLTIAGGLILALILIALAPLILSIAFHIIMLPITLINLIPDPNKPIERKPKQPIHTVEPEDEYPIH